MKAFCIGKNTIIRESNRVIVDLPMCSRTAEIPIDNNYRNENTDGIHNKSE